LSKYRKDKGLGQNRDFYNLLIYWKRCISKAFNEGCNYYR